MSKPNIWIFSLEPLDSRYTKQWHSVIPELLLNACGDRFSVKQIDGIQKIDTVTNGAFLNFSDTNYWKSSQLCNFVDLFNAGETTPNDRFLFTDTWNPCITQLAYMRDLMDQNWEIHGIWHAGAYDPSDILGYKMKKPWPWDAERSWFYSCDYNYFASNFHLRMFLHNLNIDPSFHHRAVRSGQPHDQIIEHMDTIINEAKDPNNLVIWPHRLNQDKQPEIAENLAEKFNMVITQKLSLNKAEYYQTLAQSKIIFSCALHENLGISVMEGVLAGVIPVLPDRCSYSEMYLDEFKYPSEWTSSYDSYLENKSSLIAFISDRIENYDHYLPALEQQKSILLDHYLTADIMIQNLSR